MAIDDTIRERPVIERKREWKHGDDGYGKNCPRANRPVFTAPQSIPEPCRSWGCGNGDWSSRGIVERDKKSHKLLARDGKPVKEES